MHKYPFGLSGNRRSGPNAVEHLTFSLNCVKKMALVLFKRLSHGGVLRTFKMTLVNTYPTSPTVLLTTCAGDPPAVTTAKPPAASSTKGDCSHAPKGRLPTCLSWLQSSSTMHEIEPDECYDTLLGPASRMWSSCCSSQEARRLRSSGCSCRWATSIPTSWRLSMWSARR